MAITTTVRQVGSRRRKTFIISKIAKTITSFVASTPNNIILQSILSSLRTNRLITTGSSPEPTCIRMGTSLSKPSLRVINNNLSGLSLNTRGRRSVTLSSYYTTITPKGRHRRHLLLCPDSLLSGLSLSKRHILLDRCCLGTDKVILSFLVLSLESKSGVLLLLLLYTLLLGTLGIHGTTDGLTGVSQERPIGAVSNGRSRSILGRRGSESSQRVETSGLSVRDLPADTILSELLLMLIIQLVKACSTSRTLTTRNNTTNTTGNTADSTTNSSTKSHTILLLGIG